MLSQIICSTFVDQLYPIAPKDVLIGQKNTGW